MKTPPESSSPVKKGWLYLYRSLLLKCPVCGLAPLFRSFSRLRSVKDWFEPLAGCPYCAYKYDRESGYFMAALLIFDYGLAAFFGIILLLISYFFFNHSTLPMLLFTLTPTFLFALLFVRHAKALWLAIDRYVHHESDE